MSHRHGRVGLSYALMIVGFGVLLGALLFMILDPIVTDMLEAQATVTDGADAAQANEWLTLVWGAVPLLVMAYGAWYLIVRATVEGDAV